MNNKTRNLTYGAIIAATYVVLTFVASSLGLASGAIQVRLSEMLTVMPIFMGAAVPGLFVGCVLANFLTGCALWDVIFGSIATLIGALGTYYLGKTLRKPMNEGRLGEQVYKLICILPPILSNSIIVPFILQYVYGLPDSYFYLMATVAIGEIISCYVLGHFVYVVLKKNKIIFQ